MHILRSQCMLAPFTAPDRYWFFHVRRYLTETKICMCTYVPYAVAAPDAPPSLVDWRDSRRPSPTDSTPLSKMLSIRIEPTSKVTIVTNKEAALPRREDVWSLNPKRCADQRTHFLTKIACPIGITVWMMDSWEGEITAAVCPVTPVLGENGQKPIDERRFLLRAGWNLGREWGNQSLATMPVIYVMARPRTCGYFGPLVQTFFSIFFDAKGIHCRLYFYFVFWRKDR